MTRITTARHWVTIERQKARMAAARTEANQRHGRAQREVQQAADERAAEPVQVGMSRAVVSDLADRRADLVSRRLDALKGWSEPEAMLQALNEIIAGLHGGAAFRFRGANRKPADEERQLANAVKRACCPIWWRRRLWVQVMRLSEAQQIADGRVCDALGRWYASNDAVTRRRQQVKRNRTMLERTELENEDGERWALAELSDLGPANRAIRRGELMTRIRGCEEYAETHGHPGVFMALTTPSRFHRTLHRGPPNPRWDGSNPRDAQGWLNEQWKKLRSAVARAGVKFYGFRIAEPHHDGCTHWHAMLWAETEAGLGALCMLIRRYWLEWEENEPGARERRVSMRRMEKGGATGYCAKYIAKNIDDVGAVGVEGHTDGENAMQPDLFASGAQRVDAWAAHWGIRQFQAIGQPPVTVWRELRRVKPEAAEAAPPRVQMAWDGVHRAGEQRACWFTYLEMQGGHAIGRDYGVRVAKLVQEHEGRYGKAAVARPVGVYDAAAPEKLVPSHRRKWTPRVPSKGAEAPALQRARIRAARSAAPRTRFNNCTQPTRVAGRILPPGAPLITWKQAIQLPAWAGDPYDHPR